MTHLLTVGATSCVYFQKKLKIFFILNLNDV